MKQSASAGSITNIDILRQLKAQKKAMIDEINSTYDQMIALAEKLPVPGSIRGAALQPPPVPAVVESSAPTPAAVPAGKKAASAIEIPLKGTNAEVVIAALQKNGGSATIPEIIGLLSPKHSLMKRKSPARAISGVLGELRGEELVVKGKDLRFALVK
jgi:hypothetical protein